MTDTSDETVRKVVRAEKFELVDSEGRTRAEWSTFDGGGATMRSYDNNGGIRIDVGVGKDGLAHVTLLDAEGEPRLFLHVRNDGEAVITGLGESFKPNAFQLRISKEGVLLGMGGQPPKVLIGSVIGEGGVVASIDQAGNEKTL